MPSAPQKFIGAVEDEWELFSDVSTDYTSIGHSLSLGKRVPCALKVVDLDFLRPHSLALLQRETTLMSLSKHPNVLRVRGSWMDGHKLHIALRLMNKGSAADVMRYGWPGGMGRRRLDVKAANLLIDDDGTVLLGDLGVAADLTEDTSRNPASSSHQKRPKIITAEAALRSHGRSSNSSSSSGHGAKRISFEGSSERPPPKMRKRKSFVGTPCWMAPEVIQAQQYDSSADIWSFGITALELTQGRPPRSRESTQRILLKTIQEAPPTLDREGGAYKYSRAFKEMVESCLVKDPSKRPSAEELLQSPFFKSSKKKSYLVGAILKDLPPLTSRQERRAARGATVHGTIDSWDFATTVNSNALRHTEESMDEETVFEMDESEQRSSKRRSHRISWAEHAVPEFEEPAETEPEDERPSSPSDPSDPEFLDVPGSSSSMSSPASPAAVYSEGSNLEHLLPLPLPSVPVPVPASAPRSEALAVPVPPSVPSSPGSPSGFSSSLSSSRSSPGLWKKIKGATSLRRPTSGSPIRKAKS
ncbi:Serine/threonine-protein kinase fray2 [Mycena venus]|uniref:Serine/threonine-protein kinase fray2 n=1 Tax=Mycena venus TaxID=2733690 RepID=A0A8H7CL59_9AGAR|nr:Serine/threonine-protein kinase fray2 [Mycena venus]